MAVPFRRSSALALFAIAFAGCGGIGDDEPSDPSAFRGTYVGTYSTNLQENGNLGVQISTDGTVTSSIASLTAPGMTGSLDGTVRSDGTIRGTIAYSNPSSNVDFVGTLTRDAGGHIAGTLTQTTTNGTVTLTFDVSPDILD